MSVTSMTASELGSARSAADICPEAEYRCPGESGMLRRRGYCVGDRWGGNRVDGRWIAENVGIPRLRRETGAQKVERVDPGRGSRAATWQSLKHESPAQKTTYRSITCAFSRWGEVLLDAAHVVMCSTFADVLLSLENCKRRTSGATARIRLVRWSSHTERCARNRPRRQSRRGRPRHALQSD